MYLIVNPMKTSFKKATAQKGFTLIEMLVSVGLFAVVMTISLGVIMSVIDGNKKSQAINSVSNNLSFAIESMVRDIKTGYEYRCAYSEFPITDLVKSIPSNCSPSTALNYINLISTISGAERSVHYEFVAPSGNAPGYILKKSCTAAGSCGADSKVTSPEINITDMRFYIKSPNTSQGDPNAEQPGVFLLIRGTAKVNPTTVSTFNLQTFISQRVLNI
ncbi:MAG: hypothetical protein RL094_769 [Candidatus Parcubacteria bacterium]|jgi:prepilin-type N-terminal cleavage/methylation domain-containing protein